MSISTWTLALASVASLAAQGSNDKTLRGTVKNTHVFWRIKDLMGL